MSDINLLPEELREKEIKEREAAKKVPKKVRIEMTSPSPESKPEKLKTPKPSLLSRLFARRVIKPKPFTPLPPIKPPKPEELKIPRSTKKIFHIPKPEKKEKEDEKEEKAFSIKKFGFGKERLEKVDIPSASKSKLPSSDDKKLLSPKEETVEIKEKAPKLKKKISFNPFSWLGSIFSIKSKEKPKKSIKKPEEEIFQKPSVKIDLKKKRKEGGEKEAGFDINLIPKELEKQKSVDSPKRFLASGFLIFLCLFIVGAAYAGLAWYQLEINNQIEILEKDIEGLNNQIVKYEKDKLAAFNLQKKLKLVKELLNRHIYWTEFFKQLEKYTVKDVSYSNFSMAGTERIVLSAIGKDYNSVAKQLITFQEASDFISSVEINSATAEINEEGDYSKVNFSINLTFLPNIFFKPIE